MKINFNYNSLVYKIQNIHFFENINEMMQHENDQYA